MESIKKNEDLEYGTVSYGFLCRVGCFGGDFGPNANKELYKKHCHTQIPVIKTGPHSKRVIIELIADPELKVWVKSKTKIFKN